MLGLRFRMGFRFQVGLHFRMGLRFRMCFRYQVGLRSSIFVFRYYPRDTAKRQTQMDYLKELLAPKTFSRPSYVAIVCWILLGVTLFGIFADTENSESRFDFRCGGAKSENVDLVRGKCFEQYEKLFNKFSIPVYGFVIINFSLIGIVCVIYSQIAKFRDVTQLENSHDGNVERQSNPDNQTHKLFIAYCCQLCTRLALGIIFMVLQFQFLYPFNFPSNFNCKLTSAGNQARNSSAAIENSTQTLHECHNQRATKKTFWLYTVFAVNGIFAFLIVAETICILLRARKEGAFMEE